MKRDYSGLQNGSDIRGVAIEGENPRTLGPEEAFRLSAAFGKWLSDRCGKAPAEMKIAVGHDSRLSAGSLKEHVCRGLAFLGAKALDCGLASTPAMFMATQFAAYDCDGAIMITASHLPQDRNGFKYFSREGGLDKEDISAILKSAAQLEPGTEIAPAAAEKAELMSTYCAFLREKIEKEVGGKQPLAGLKIVVDAGNGAGGFYALNVLAPLGADVSGSQFLEPDGSFPNHQPNPENKEAMASICQAVLDNHADLGLIFDTDVDRSSAVDKNGREINRNAIVAMAAALIAPEHPGTTVVTDSITSDELTEYLEKCLGLKHLRFRRGYRNVINKAIELNRQGIDSQLAIETSGHAAYKENYFLDDGAYLATKIVIKAAQMKKAGADLSAVLASLREPTEALEKRFTVLRDDFAAYGQQVLDGLESWIDENGASFGASVVRPNYEGVRINFDNEKVRGWCLLRKSLHDPKLPLNVEVTSGSCSDILQVIEDFLRGWEVE